MGTLMVRELLPLFVVESGSGCIANSVDNTDGGSLNLNNSPQTLI